MVRFDKEALRDTIINSFITNSNVSIENKILDAIKEGVSQHPGYTLTDIGQFVETKSKLRLKFDVHRGNSYYRLELIVHPKEQDKIELWLTRAFLDHLSKPISNEYKILEEKKPFIPF